MYDSNLKMSSYAKYVTYLALSVLMFGLGMLGWLGYNYYSNRAEQAVFADLAENVEEFNKFLSSGRDVTLDGENKLDDLEHAFKIGSERHSKSKLAPYFRLYEADALIQKGKFDEALNVLNLAINGVDKANPFYYLFLSKGALIKTDNESLKEEGLKELNDLANDINNPFSAMAGYYLGLFYYHSNDEVKAKDIWQNVLDKNKKDCSWCNLISSKLKDIA